MLQPKLTKVEPVKPLKLCLYYETVSYTHLTLPTNSRV